jgi:hypothetical protein
MAHGKVLEHHGDLLVWMSDDSIDRVLAASAPLDVGRVRARGMGDGYVCRVVVSRSISLKVPNRLLKPLENDTVSETSSATAVNATYASSWASKVVTRDEMTSNSCTRA